MHDSPVDSDASGINEHGFLSGIVKVPSIGKSLGPLQNFGDIDILVVDCEIVEPRIDILKLFTKDNGTLDFYSKVFGKDHQMTKLGLMLSAILNRDIEFSKACDISFDIVMRIPLDGFDLKRVAYRSYGSTEMNQHSVFCRGRDLEGKIALQCSYRILHTIFQFRPHRTLEHHKCYIEDGWIYFLYILDVLVERRQIFPCSFIVRTFSTVNGKLHGLSMFVIKLEVLLHNHLGDELRDLGELAFLNKLAESGGEHKLSLCPRLFTVDFKNHGVIFVIKPNYVIVIGQPHDRSRDLVDMNRLDQ